MTHILLIDDDPTTRMLLKRSLQKQGYEVAEALNGEEGVQKAAQLHPALIICDWMMPIMDGLDVCRQVKANANLSTTFFILLTARGAVEDRVTGLDAGADEFLSKPIDMNELKARVRAGLRIHQLSQDLQKQKQKLETELAEAAGYVRSILPTYLKDDRLHIDARFLPSMQLGGDCYDFQWLDDDRLAAYLLDVSGHGVGSALLSISVLNVLRSRALPNTDFGDPAQVLEALNQAFPMQEASDEFYEGKYFTIWYGVYHRSTGKLEYASAGHPPAVLVTETKTGTEIVKLKTPGLPVGLFDEAVYTCNDCIIESPSTLYVFSDGAYEIHLEDGSIWGLDNLADLMKEADLQITEK